MFLDVVIFDTFLKINIYIKVPLKKMDLKVNKRNKYISNGCRRHVRFMKILKRDISCVGDWFEKKKFYLSSLRDYMVTFLQNVPLNVNINVYSEIPVFFQCSKKHRRLDVLLHIENIAYILIEFKTTNNAKTCINKPPVAYVKQTKETAFLFSENVLNFYSVSKPIQFYTETHIPFVSLILTKIYKEKLWQHQTQHFPATHLSKRDGTVEITRTSLPKIPLKYLITNLIMKEKKIIQYRTKGKGSWNSKKIATKKL